jgi:hypothetical protein
VKLRILSREQIYDNERKAFRGEVRLTRLRDQALLEKMLEKVCPGVELRLNSTKEDSETYLDDDMNTVISLIPEEQNYHWLLHEAAHALQDWDDEEEHSPEWLLIYLDLLKACGFSRAAHNLGARLL